MPEMQISGQLNSQERQLITSAILDAGKKPQILIEVGTWLGGGSTLHILKALHENGAGHLWGIEADGAIYHEMIENIRKAAPMAADRFTPLFGFSNKIIPKWLREMEADCVVDFAFLDGGDNPGEQISEFKLLADRLPVGGRLMAHDAKLRKGKWLRPYLSRLDNWEVRLHDVSSEGLLDAVKLRANPSLASKCMAEAFLFILRLSPLELVGRFLPRKVCALILGALPNKLALKISQGRK